VFTALNGSTGATSYEWFIDGNSSSVATNFTTSLNEVTNPPANSVTHNFELIATDANGCMDTLDQDIVVSMPYADITYTLTGASVNGAGEFTCPPVFASFTDNSGSYGTITNWDWNFGDGKFSTLQDPNNTYVFAGVYSAGLTITDEYGCTNDTLLFEFLEIFGPSGDPDWTSLGDVCGQSFIFDAANLNNVDNISWNLGDGSIINSMTPFQYNYQSYQTFNPTATLSDSLGCEVIYPLPPIFIINNGLDAQFTASPAIGPMGTQFLLDNNSTFTSAPIVTWTWYFLGDTIVNFTGANISSSFGLPGTYPITLVVADANGCLDTYTSSVLVTNDFHPPNVFTPNGDGINDYFSLDAPIFKWFDIVILNRWGNVVHERQGGTGVQLWDGFTPNGTLVNDGVYFYKLTGILVDDTAAEKHGNVTVLSGP
jgi:gliding motility-associated-like protein